MLIYVRHGKTSLNQSGGDERLRGWLPVPLSPEGHKQAQKAGMRLAQQLPGPPNSFVTSDLHRAMQTAAHISQSIGVQAKPDQNIRDWNTGDLAGEKVTEVLPKLKDLVHHPDEPAPGGEPLNTYLSRFVPEMKKKVNDPGIHLVVGHARGSAILEGIASPVGGKGVDIDKKFLLERPQLQPGGIMIIGKDWNPKIDNIGSSDQEKLT